MRSGNKQVASRRDLGKRDRAILADVIRYRALTNELIHQRHFENTSLNATTKVTQRLHQQGWLQRREIDSRKLYFAAGRQLCKQFGLPMSRTRPLGLQTLATSLALANYCLRSKRSLRLMTPDEITSQANWIPRKQRTLPMAVPAECQEGADLDVLYLIRVDLGGRPAHVARKCQQDFTSRAEVRAFRSLARDKKLVFAVLTTTATKRRYVKHELGKRQWPCDVHFDIAVIDDLANLLVL